MNILKNVAVMLAAGVWLAINAGCTKNPFGEDKKISSGTRQIRGNVVLDDRSDPEGTYIWLESFDIGARADQNGFFQLNLPPPSSQGTPGGVSGVFRLYFYLANYTLASSQVVTQNGAFLYSKGALDENGNLTGPKELEKFLDINIQVAPDSVPANFPGTIEVQINLQARLDTVTVTFPSSTGRTFGAVILKQIGGTAVFVFPSLIGELGRETLVIGLFQRARRMSFSFAPQTLPPGQYEVVPHMFITHQTIPRELSNNFGQNLQEPGLQYLNLPMRRRGGRLAVQ